MNFWSNLIPVCNFPMVPPVRLSVGMVGWLILYKSGYGLDAVCELFSNHEKALDYNFCFSEIFLLLS